MNGKIILVLVALMGVMYPSHAATQTGADVINMSFTQSGHVGAATIVDSEIFGPMYNIMTGCPKDEELAAFTFCAGLASAAVHETNDKAVSIGIMTPDRIAHIRIVPRADLDALYTLSKESNKIAVAAVVLAQYNNASEVRL